MNRMNKKELQERQLEKFQQAVSQSHSMFVFMDPGGYIEYINDRLTQILGFTIEDLIGTNHDFTPKDENGLHNRNKIAERLNAVGYYSGELQVEKKDGNKIWVKASIAIVNKDNKPDFMVGIMDDITEQKRQVQLLKIQNQIDSLSNLSTNLNLSLKLAFLNLLQIDWIDAGGIYLFEEDRKTLKLVFSTGLSEDYIKSVSVFSSKETPAKAVLKGQSRYSSVRQFLEPIKNVMIREKLTFSVAIPLIYKKKVIGSLNLGSRTAEEISQADQLIVESIASRLANLIVLVQTRNQLIKSNLKLNRSLLEIKGQQQILIQKSRLESLGELSAGLAHEINQPISVISLAMENVNYKLLQKAATEDYLSHKFATITHNINKIRELIDHVRIFSRDQGTIMFERIEINKVISNALSMINAQLRNRHINVSTGLADDLGYTLGNPSRLEQVILNLLSNAMDALEEKEKKSGFHGRQMEINIKTQVVKDKILINIRDNGTGISQDNIQRIFIPFFTTKSAGHGTGLGLPIVYGIIREMQGEITANSEEGSFTEISITLPHFINNNPEPNL